ncbi:RsmB/NOP family class I SAM-dependent RNA methyltransferase [uncultured Alsobacter sp.]|uniref:RsmB/NOP family class I SAM-dependent RNA methyltransferase n=1 Tax=uncultured Alsobacter sp. TaxID=1748258 RepID=UPI0025FCC2B7|nr:RsmB/NOP family class I SAM-dependent RNA methyltransferase [uncultured Alsobacter sp.]
MTPAARLSAAIEVLADIEGRRRPAADALKDWGLSHRFAGSGDRSAIAGLVFDTLRRRASGAWIAGGEGPRATLLGAMRLARNWGVDRLQQLCTGERFAPAPLTPEETAALSRKVGDALADAPAWVQGDYPEWLDAAMTESFGEDRVVECRALARRAPVDLRANTIRVDRQRCLEELSSLGAQETPWSPIGLRIAVGEDARAPAVQAEPAFQKGWLEVQDEGSQLAALLACGGGAKTAIDLCAGAGGKTLALAAALGTHSQVFATDSDKRRLAPIYDRLARAGARNAEVRAPRGRDDEPLDDLEARADLVLVDAPCTGTGTWRRNPDAKWRVRPNSLADRVNDQAATLDRAARFVKPGGRIAYVTCSVLAQENDASVESFLARKDGFSVVPPVEVAAGAGLAGLAEFLSPAGHGLQLSPHRTDTDGFFVAVLRRGA